MSRRPKMSAKEATRMVKDGVLRYEWSIVSIFFLPLSKGVGTLKSETVSTFAYPLYGD